MIRAQPTAAKRRRVTTCAWLLLVALPAVVLMRTDWRTALETDIRNSVPELQDTLEASHARQLIRNQLTGNVMVELTVPEATQADIAPGLSELIAQQPLFGQPFITGDTAYRDELLAYLQQHRETLFFAPWLEARWLDYQQIGSDAGDFNTWLAQHAVTELDHFIEQPAGMAYAEHIPEDPLLLLPNALAKLQPPPTSAQASNTTAWIPVAADPMSPDGQAHIAEALAELTTAIKQRWPDAHVAHTGVYEIARTTEALSKRDAMRLNIAMVIVIATLLIVLLGRPWLFLLTLIPLCVAGLWAIAAGFIIFGAIHVLAIGIASIVLGLAVDYTIHLLTHHGDDRSTTAWQRIRLPLVTGCLSSCLGLAFLLLSPMPAIRQVGLIVPAGLLGALLAVRYLLPPLLPAHKALRLRPILAKPLPTISARCLWLSMAAIWVAALLMLATTVNLRDDVRDYQVPLGETASRFEELASRLKPALNTTQWATFAKTPTELLARLDTLDAAKLIAPNNPVLSLARSDQTETLSRFVASRATFSEALDNALAKNGFDTAAFQAFQDKLNDLPQLTSETKTTETLTQLAELLHGPMAGILLTDGTLWVSVFSVNDDATVPTAMLPYTRVLDERTGLNQTLRHARQSVQRVALYSALIVVAGVCLVFGWRRGLVIALLPLWAVTHGLLAAIAIGGSVNLLSLIGVILAYCLALDYAAFVVHFRGQAPTSVRVSALTTATAFAVLAFSSINAVAQMGAVVAFSVAFAWLAAELLAATRNATPTP